MHRSVHQFWRIRPSEKRDRDWIETVLTRLWGSPCVASLDRLHDAVTLPGFIAASEDERLGLVTYHLVDRECEVVTLNSLREGYGIGTALLQAVRQQAVRAGAERLWLVTSNDNLIAQTFYPKRGLVLARVHRDAVTRVRDLKPEIPLVADNGLPIRDMLEYEELL
jgi:GNAT superfamily N-acetyltransferase